MSTEENKARVRDYIEQVWNGRRIDLLAEFIAKDVVLHSSPDAVGREILKQRVAVFHNTFPDLCQTVEDEIADGDKVVLRWTVNGTHQGEFLGVPATGKEVASSGMSIFRLAGGKIVELWVEFDIWSIMQQLGAIPSPGQGQIE